MRCGRSAGQNAGPTGNNVTRCVSRVQWRDDFSSATQPFQRQSRIIQSHVRHLSAQQPFTLPRHQRVICQLLRTERSEAERLNELARQRSQFDLARFKECSGYGAAPGAGDAWTMPCPLLEARRRRKTLQPPADRAARFCAPWNDLYRGASRRNAVSFSAAGQT